MSGICGRLGRPDPEALRRVEAMLAAATYRGDASATWAGEVATLGWRGWAGRTRAGSGIAVTPTGKHVALAGRLTPPMDEPAVALAALVSARDLGRLDGAFSAAIVAPGGRTLTLIRDPFGIRPLYVAEHAGALWFASELKQLVALTDLSLELDDSALHHYLTFSFVPGEATPLRAIRRLLPGHLLTATWDGDRVVVESPVRYAAVEEAIEPLEQAEASRRVWRGLRDAVGARLFGEAEVGLYLSGGIDSSAVGAALRAHDVPTRAFTLDFGDDSVEREEALAVATHLDMPMTRVPVRDADIEADLDRLIWLLDLPFGDPVTGPHFRLGLAARAAGLSSVFNGEGGDQLLGGWTSKPMVAAAVYGLGAPDDGNAATPEEQYLKSFHRFYGLESELYTPDFATRVGGPGQRRSKLAPYLGEGAASSFLHRVRLTDLWLKGTQNLLPRAERMAAANGLDVRAPLFDRSFVELAFRLPPALKLHGACEKYVLKLAMQKRLPEDIVWRRKFGMTVPILRWLDGALRPRVEEWLGDASVRRRGLFRTEFVRTLREHSGIAGETRRRRYGERLWALLILEGWLRRFVDNRGRAP